MKFFMKITKMMKTMKTMKRKNKLIIMIKLKINLLIWEIHFLIYPHKNQSLKIKVNFVIMKLVVIQMKIYFKIKV
jgi:hypothetical protein